MSVYTVKGRVCMSTVKKSKQLAVDTVLFGISAFGSKILVFLLTPLYTAVLLTEEYGIADLINTTVHLIYPVLTLAMADATLRYALDKEKSPYAVLSNSIVIILASVALLTAFYPVMAMMQSEVAVQLVKYWWYFVVTYAVFNLHLCFANFVKGLGKTKLFAIQGIVQTVTVILCNIYFLLITKIGLQGYLLSLIIGWTVPTVLLFFAGDIYKYLFPFKPNKALLGDMLKYSIPMIPTLLAWSINMYINKYMLIGLLPAGEGLGASGIFSVANKIPSLLTSVITIFTQAWALSAIANVNDADESEYYTKVYSAMHIITLVGCIAIAPLAKPFSTLMFDPDYYTAWQHIPFLTISAFYSCLCSFLASAFRAYKKTGQLFVSVAIGAAVNIALNLILIPTIGVIGASIATAASFLVTWIVRMKTIQKLVHLKIRLIHTVITYILAILACFLISFDVPGAYVCYGVAVAAIVLLNWSDIKGLWSVATAVVKKILKRS